jgi:uncharacterized protein
MELSKYNIVSRIKDSEEYFIVNSLYGSADIIDGDTLRELREKKTPRDDFISRGYLADPLAEEKRFREAYLQFLDDRETEELQLFFACGYNCNFGCSYCYQSGYENNGKIPGTPVIDAFFDYVDSAFGTKKKYITLFGGEPLLPGKDYRNLISSFMDNARSRNIDVAVVTNGYCLVEYIDILQKSKIREVQVTLDGTREVHNSRRHLKNGTGTFDKIVRGTDLLLEHGIPVNLRVVIDKENIGNLPLLARFAIDRGWTGSGSFSTQLGRNYELHGCQAASGRLYSRIGMYADLYKLIRQHPEILEFHQPSFSVSGYLSKNGQLPSPLFDACPGAKTEWAFDHTGKIYPCTATVGKAGEELGTYYPEKTMNQEKADMWAERDILAISECRDCGMGLLCGGGCAAVAKKQYGGGMHPDCRPVKELLELGMALYFTGSE